MPPVSSTLVQRLPVSDAPLRSRAAVPDPNLPGLKGCARHSRGGDGRACRPTSAAIRSAWLTNPSWICSLTFAETSRSPRRLAFAGLVFLPCFGAVLALNRWCYRFVNNPSFRVGRNSPAFLSSR